MDQDRSWWTFEFEKLQNFRLRSLSLFWDNEQTFVIIKVLIFASLWTYRYLWQLIEFKIEFITILLNLALVNYWSFESFWKKSYTCPFISLDLRFFSHSIKHYADLFTISMSSKLSHWNIWTSSLF